MPKPHPTTRNRLIAAKGSKSYRTLASLLGLEEHWFGTLYRLHRDEQIGRERENAIRDALGLEPLPVFRLVAVNPNPKPRRRYWRPCLSPELREACEGLDVEELIRKGLRYA